MVKEVLVVLNTGFRTWGSGRAATGAFALTFELLGGFVQVNSKQDNTVHVVTSRA